jgi:hypothetical protein
MSLAPWCNWLTRGPFKAESPGSSPGGATKFMLHLTSAGIKQYLRFSSIRGTYLNDVDRLNIAQLLCKKVLTVVMVGVYSSPYEI